MTERLASLISGGGSTMEQIVLAAKTGKVPGLEIACVVASTREAGGLKKAAALGIPTEVVDPDDFRGEGRRIDREGFGRRIVEVLRGHGATVVTQNGWMPLTPERVIEAYPDRLFNQHPGRPKEFGGKGMFGRRVHAAALLFHRMTGRNPSTTVIGQRVHQNFDEGEVVQAGHVAIEPADTVEDLQRRALPVEHAVQIALLQHLLRGTLTRIDLQPLLQPGEEGALELARRHAMLLYPKG